MGDTSKEIVIFVVEDDDIDVEMIRRAFEKQKIANKIRRAVDGVEALQILRGEADHEPIHGSFLILLDINMPRMNGIEFLRELRSDERLRKSIVFVLTTSDSDRDKIEAYDQNVAGYILKSNVGDDFSNLITMMDHFWRYIEFPPS